MMLNYPFIHHTPTAIDVELIRLLLSTFQDGSGMLAKENGRTIPGWRDYERTIATALKGHATENKSIYDVLLDAENGNHFGISCKMRELLREVYTKGRVTTELSNASGVFWEILKPSGINQENYTEHAKETGSLIMKLVENWHKKVDVNNGGTVITEKSFFLVLQYNDKKNEYQLFQFPIRLPDPDLLEWSVNGRHLCGKLDGYVIIEWYGFSGGQLKYYPKVNDAIWYSDIFKLEPLPKDTNSLYINKVKNYFPEKWSVFE